MNRRCVRRDGNTIQKSFAFALHHGNFGPLYVQGVYRRTRAACKVCTVALALCFIGLVVAMAHGRRGLAPTDICQLRAICHNHAAWLARPVQRPVRHFEVGTQAHAHLVGSISRRPLSNPI